MNRIRLITEYVHRSTGRILHLGCAGADRMQDSSMWLHRHIVRAAERRPGSSPGDVLGIDLDRDRVQEMRQLGYQAEVCDVLGMESRFSGEEFQLVIAGEIIEHIPDQGGFLRACRSVLAPGGGLLISTPNPFGIAFVAWYWLTGREYTGSGHVVWQSPGTMKGLADFADLNLTSFHPCTYGATNRRWWAFPLSVAEIWPSMRPTVLYELRRDAGQGATG